MSQAVKLFVLPPVLALAAVASAILGLMNYQAQRSMETTFVLQSAQRSGACALCHEGGPIRLR